jgi:branched-chain amino acid transport system ATP-binding protein
MAAVPLAFWLRSHRHSRQCANLAALPTHRISALGIGYVPEQRCIFTGLTVEENLRVTRQFERRDGWSLERIYALFPKLAEIRRRNGDLLSGGEQQMLTIARTLMGNPCLLLLDEPSEGLAPLVIHNLRDQIMRLKADGLSILLCEQNMGFARALSDRLYVIDRGSIFFEGRFEELDADPDMQARHLFVAPASTAPTRSIAIA